MQPTVSVFVRALAFVLGVGGFVIGDESAERLADTEQTNASPAFTAIDSDEGITILEGIRPVLTYQR